MRRSTGMVRKVDELGRIVLSMELRKTRGIEEKTPLEIYVNDEEIILKKYQPLCIFCGSDEGLGFFKGKQVCAGCASELGELGRGK